MHPQTLFITLLSSLTTTTNAAAIRQANDPHLLDFRTFGAPGCSEDNQGIWTFTESDRGKGCRSFLHDYGVESVQSLLLVDLASGGAREYRSELLFHLHM